jgi:hypothetical protein
MATKSTATAAPRKGTARTTTKPAAKEPAKKPAPKKPAVVAEGGVTLKDLAAKLNREPKSLRASIRRIMGGPQVGKGSRYHWDSWNDKELKELMSSLQKTDAE